MNNSTQTLKYYIYSFLFIISLQGYTQDFSVQHIQDDVPNSGLTNNSITPVSSLNNAFLVANNNRKAHGGSVSNSGNMEGDDMAGSRVLSNTSTITYTREAASSATNMRFNTSVWEYIGAPGGLNEFIVRGRYSISLNGTTNSVTQALSGISNANKCIPFITGILNNSGGDDADSGTAIAYLENATTLRIEKGSTSNNVTVNITVVEFTGSNWSVYHADSGNVASDTGSISISSSSLGTGASANVSNWNQAIIFSQHRGDNTAGTNNVNDAIADNWPVFNPGADTQTVNWTFDAQHVSGGFNRHFIHILDNNGLSVSRFQNNSSTQGETTIDISSSGLSNINEALIVGSSTSSGTGSAYGRGWRNYYLNSTTQAAHWSHRSGNTMSHEIQIIDLSGLTTNTNPEIDVLGNSVSLTSGQTSTSFTDHTKFGNTSVSGSIIRTYTIQNTGGADLTINPTISLTNGTEFTLSTPPAATITPGGSTTFSITFSPSSAGTFTDTVSITNNDSDENPFTFNIEGSVQDLSNFGFGGEWKYLDDGTDQGTAWYGVAFDDSSWALGDAELGFGDGDENTTVADVNQITTYFRKSFEVTASEAALANMIFDLVYDDAAVVYLNGVEVWRMNISGAVSYSTFADSDSGDNATASITLPNALITGTNVVAVEIHQRTATSSDISFDLDLYVQADYNINSGGSWSYLDNGSDQGTAWYGTTFDYSSWATGNAELGYGDGDETTVVSFGSDSNNKHVTTYFRRSFTASAADVANSTLVMNAIRDDGMAVYINGVEVWRNNLPQGVINYNTLAASTVGGTDETTWITKKINNLLVLGNNEIGVEIHQREVTSSDLSFNFSLFTNNDYVFTPPAAPDVDGDFVADYIDSDDDTDGIPDIEEGCYTSNMEALNTTGGEDSITSDFPINNHPMDDGNEIDFSTTGTFNNITSYLAGEHGFAIRVHGPGTYGTITFDFDTDVEGLFFKLVDFDENETWTVDIYDDTNTLIDLTTSNNIYHIGSYIEQTGNTFDDIYDGTATNNNGDILASDTYGSVYFYFPSTLISRIVFTADQPDGSTIRIAAMHYCGLDTDGDGIDDYYDSDSDNDGIPDLVEAGGVDTDGNGIIDDTTDTDGDGLADAYDITPNVYFAEEITTLNDYDIDNDSYPNRIDLDSDNDGILDVVEAGELDTDSNGFIDGFIDSDSDGYHDSFDGASAILITGADTDADGVPNTYPNDNHDNNGLPNFMDMDSDDDGITDNVEAQATHLFTVYSNTETDTDGIPDIFDGNVGFGGSGLTPIDTDFDCTPDYLDTNSDDDLENDSLEGHDTNGDGVVDGSDTPNSDTGLFVGTDSDNDGIDDGFDNNDGVTDASNSSLSPTSHPIFDNGYDRDWRSSYSPIDFDGVNDYIVFGDNLDITGNFTLEAWILQKNSSASLASIIAKRDIKSGNFRGYHLAINSSDQPNLRWYDNSGNVILDITSPYAISNNKWHHVSASYDGTTATIYIDGVSVVTGTTATPPVDGTEKFMIGAMYDSDNICDFAFNHFDGHIDEVRVWNVSLSTLQIREMMNQEIQNNAGNVRGAVIPLDISGGLNWSDLRAYYSMNNNIPEDLSGNRNNGIPKYINTIQVQNAPIPYTTKASGMWEVTSGATPWLYGDSVWNAPNSIGVDGSTLVDWNIVRTDHDLTIDTNANLGQEISVLGMVQNSDIVINGDTTLGTGNGLTVTHYLKLDGNIDLQGESQLIQSSGSVLDVDSSGIVERDQQGTADLFTYNYWSSPVGISNTTSNNNSYILPNVLRDGTDPNNPVAINFVSSGYNGNPGPPIGIADYWIWKYNNLPSDNYPSWQHIRSTGTIHAGEGYTMKGNVDTGGVITNEQNYVFEGKPNNGEISLTLSSGNDYLVGNPYPSAIDANEFILDNISDGAGRAATNIIDGSLYFWDHFANSTHVLAEYEGGYATYNLMGGVVAISNHILINSSGLTGTKVPERYIPVSQGFFVISDTGGSVMFKNNQRIYKTEASNPSTFLRVNTSNNYSHSANNTEGDTRQKIRLHLSSPEGYERHLLVGVDSLASNGIDRGFDALLNDNTSEDMYWMIENEKFVIQGVDNFNTTQVLPLGLKTSQNGISTISIEQLENIDDNLNIYIHDIQLNQYHDLRASDFIITLDAGEYNSRFAIVFEQETLGIDDNSEALINAYFNIETNSIVINNPNFLEIDSVELYNMLGQVIYKNYTVETSNKVILKVNDISTGTYIINVVSDNYKTTKKVIVN